MSNWYRFELRSGRVIEREATPELSVLDIMRIENAWRASPINMPAEYLAPEPDPRQLPLLVHSQEGPRTAP